MKPRAGEKNHFVQTMLPRGGGPETMKLLFYRRKSIYIFYTFIQFPLKSSNLSSVGKVPPFKDFSHLPTRIIFLKILRDFKEFRTYLAPSPVSQPGCVVFRVLRKPRGDKQLLGKSCPCESDRASRRPPPPQFHRALGSS